MISVGMAQDLRRELSARNQRYARENRLPHCLSYGEAPVVCYEPYEENDAPRHGNFLPATYEAILADAEWRARLSKPHSQAKRSLPNNGRRWRELDSSNSSDALLMNVFCYPRVFRDGRVAALLGVPADARPQFGVRARVPLANGNSDRTEIDMRLGDLLVEAKLTESDFQTKAKQIVEGYRDFAEVFVPEALPMRTAQSLTPAHCEDASADDQDVPVELTGAVRRQGGEQYRGYQLIRNVLAADALGTAFSVVCDARRSDLIEAWYAVMQAVRQAELRTRCKVITWQEIAAAVPARLQVFLEEKYGITP